MLGESSIQNFSDTSIWKPIRLESSQNWSECYVNVKILKDNVEEILWYFTEEPQLFWGTLPQNDPKHFRNQWMPDVYGIGETLRFPLNKAVSDDPTTKEQIKYACIALYDELSEYNGFFITDNSLSFSFQEKRAISWLLLAQTFFTSIIGGKLVQNPRLYNIVLRTHHAVKIIQKPWFQVVERRVFW